MFLSIIIFILIISFLVLSHEFGHFVLAKLSGVGVDEFGLGYPPRILGFYKEGGKRRWVFGSKSPKTESTIYSINLIPIGGFNRIRGEEVREENDLKDERSFNSKPLPVRALILSGGILAGLFVSVVIFYFILASSQFTSYEGLIFNYKFPFGSQRNLPMITGILDGSPAQKAGLVPNEIVLSAGGRELRGLDQFIKIVRENGGRKLLLTVKNLKTKKTMVVSVVPQPKLLKGVTGIGVGLQEVAEVSYKSFPEKVFSGFLQSANLFHYSMAGFYYLLKLSLTRHSISPVARGTGSIVAVFAITKLAIQEVGWVGIFNLTALLSLALAFTNLLPLPALDGGRLVFIGYESVFKKRVSPAIENRINAVGFLILILLNFLVIYKDIFQYKNVLFK